MTAEEFLHRTRAAERDVSRFHWTSLLTACAVLLAMLLFSHSPLWRESSRPYWLRHTLLAGMSASFLFAAVAPGIYYRLRLLKKHGLLCPECGRALSGRAALSAFSSGNCDRCGAHVLDLQASPSAAAAPAPICATAPLPPPVGAERDKALPAPAHPSGLLSRRELAEKLARFYDPWEGVRQPLIFPVPGIMLFSLWRDREVSGAVFFGGTAVCLTLSLLYARHSRHERYERPGLCCPGCREPLHPHGAALEALVTNRCPRCNSPVFAPGAV